VSFSESAQRARAERCLCTGAHRGSVAEAGNGSVPGRWPGTEREGGRWMVSGRRQRRARSPWPRGVPQPDPRSSSPRAPSPNARTRTDAAEDVPTLPAETEVSAMRPVRFRPGLSAPSTIQSPTPWERSCVDDVTRGTRSSCRAVPLASRIVRPVLLRSDRAVPARSDPGARCGNRTLANPQLSLQP
jgi:hypothetical protein